MMDGFCIENFSFYDVMKVVIVYGLRSLSANEKMFFYTKEAMETRIRKLYPEIEAEEMQEREDMLEVEEVPESETMKILHRIDNLVREYDEEYSRDRPGIHAVFLEVDEILEKCEKRLNECRDKFFYAGGADWEADIEEAMEQ